MNWFKAAFVKLADPHKELNCADCGKSFLTDLYWEDASRHGYQVVGHDGRLMNREEFRSSPHLAKYEASNEYLQCPHCGVERMYSFKRPVGHCSPEVTTPDSASKPSFTFPNEAHPLVVSFD